MPPAQEAANECLRGDECANERDLHLGRARQVVVPDQEHHDQGHEQGQREGSAEVHRVQAGPEDHLFPGVQPVLHAPHAGFVPYA